MAAVSSTTTTFLLSFTLYSATLFFSWWSFLHISTVAAPRCRRHAARFFRYFVIITYTTPRHYDVILLRIDIFIDATLHFRYALMAIDIIGWPLAALSYAT